MSAYGGPNVVENGLIGCWDAANYKSYPGSGTAWIDLSGSGANGTLTNGPTFTPGYVTFDGVNDYFITGAVPNINTSAITHCCLFRVNSVPAGATTIFGGSDSLIHGIKVSGIASPVFDAQYNISASNIGTLNAFTGSLNTWYFLTTSWSSTNTVKLYRNQNLVSQSTTGTGTLSSYPYHTMAEYSQSNFVACDIAFASVYNRELSQTEISNNYYAVRGRFGI
jgi:hypothetical protein